MNEDANVFFNEVKHLLDTKLPKFNVEIQLSILESLHADIEDRAEILEAVEG